MINKKFIQQLNKEHKERESERRQIISLANVVLHDSKRVIFSLHRGDMEKAEASLAEIEKTMVSLDKKFGYKRLNEEGAYKAGVEEFVEAKTFYDVISGKKIDRFKTLNIAHESYLGGICDLTGELVRRAINQTAAGNRQEAERIKGIINEIMAELVEFDFTGYLRTKYDQAKSNLKKIEQIDYEIKLRS